MMTEYDNYSFSIVMWKSFIRFSNLKVVFYIKTSKKGTECC